MLMCHGRNCPLAPECYRYRRVPDNPVQEYVIEGEPIIVSCTHFEPIPPDAKTRSIKSLRDEYENRVVEDT